MEYHNLVKYLVYLKTTSKFLYSTYLKTPGNFTKPLIFVVFTGYRNGTLYWNGLNTFFLPI